MGTKPKAKAKKAPKPATRDASKPKAPIGRPSIYTPELAARICHEIANGISLRKICDRPDMPNKDTILSWCGSNKEFSDQYARAREAQADYWADEIIDISDDSSQDEVEKERPDGSTYMAVDHEHINRSRLRVDTRKWLMARMAPKKYGDRVQNDSTINVNFTLAELVNLSYGQNLPALPAPTVVDHEGEK